MNSETRSSLGQYNSFSTIKINCVPWVFWAIKAKPNLIIFGLLCFQLLIELLKIFQYRGEAVPRNTRVNGILFNKSNLYTYLERVTILQKLLIKRNS